jgi:hypothetical protein
LLHIGDEVFLEKRRLQVIDDRRILILELGDHIRARVYRATETMKSMVKEAPKDGARATTGQDIVPATIGGSLDAITLTTRASVESVGADKQRDG